MNVSASKLHVTTRPTKQTTSLTSSHNKFSSQLFQTIVAKNERSNVVFSPVSIYLALLMATSGAKGDSLSELVKGLGIDHVPSSIEEWRSIVAPFASDFFANLNNKILNVANNAFVCNSAKLDAKYKVHVKKAFQAQVTQCDFEGNAVNETKKINDWVSLHTNQQIKDLIPADAINELTKVVLVNAVHFLGEWRDAFKKTDTCTSKFYGVDGETSCHLMNKNDSKERYGVDGDFHWVTIPFSDPKYKMTIIAVINSDNQNKLDEWTAKKLKKGIVAFPTSEATLSKFAIPRFEVEQGNELSEILKNAPFNIKKPFSIGADFSNIINDSPVPIFIDKVIHKAHIKVDETGAEASAATATVLKLSCIPKTASFVVNSPFAFVLSHESTQTILFAGKINKL